jgi:hypothetical protein
MIKVAEHTWGLDMKTFCPNYITYLNSEFEKVVNTTEFLLMKTSWIEQRAYISNAIELLGTHPLAGAIKNYLKIFESVQAPSTQGYKKMSNFSTVFETSKFFISFDENGGMNSLVERESGYNWAGNGSSIFRPTYQTVDWKEYNTFLDEYVYCSEVYFVCKYFHMLDFAKPDLNYVPAENAIWLASLSSLWRMSDDQSELFLLELQMPQESNTFYGAPSSIWLSLNITEYSINATFYMLDKTSTRLPEALWFSVIPSIANSSATWSLNKLGSIVNPFHVIGNGSMHLHGVEYVSCDDGDGAMVASSLDVSVVGLGAPNPFPTPFVEPNLGDGFHWLIYNNIWGTNVKTKHNTTRTR